MLLQGGTQSKLPQGTAGSMVYWSRNLPSVGGGKVWRSVILVDGPWGEGLLGTGQRCSDPALGLRYRWQNRQKEQKFVGVGGRELQVYPRKTAELSSCSHSGKHDEWWLGKVHQRMTRLSDRLVHSSWERLVLFWSGTLSCYRYIWFKEIQFVKI